MASPTAACWSIPSTRPTAPPPRPESSRATSSSPSTASRSRMAISWSPTSPRARSVPPSQLGIMRNGNPQTLNVGIADRAKLFADNGVASRRQRRARRDRRRRRQAGHQGRCHPCQPRLQARHQGRRHRHHRPPRLFRRRDRPRQRHHHRRDQQAAGHRRGSLPLHRRRPQVRPGRCLRGAQQQLPSLCRGLLRRWNPAVTRRNLTGWPILSRLGRERMGCLCLLHLARFQGC